MEAVISGTQRKTMRACVYPAGNRDEDGLIWLRNGRTLPFVVTRKWSAPAGHYPEVWRLIDERFGKVLYEGPERTVSVWGLQGLTKFSDEVPGGLSIPAGKYKLFFFLGGHQGGEIDVEVQEAPSEQVA